jgi:hypothetical protein
MTQKETVQKKVRRTPGTEMVGVRFRREDIDVVEMLKAARRAKIFGKSDGQIFIHCARNFLPQFFSHLKKVQDAILKRSKIRGEENNAKKQNL